MSQSVGLQSGGARCVVLPALGGSLGGWWVDGQALLRPADPRAIERGDPAGLSGFPLVPYSNRIAGGRFVWNGGSHQLRRNRPGEPHALHGVGWQRPWRVRDLDASCVELALDHPGDDDWPWPFAARQRITLMDHGLDLELSARNLAGEAVPLSFGYHPYFVRAGAWIRLDARRVWLADRLNLPARCIEPVDRLDLSVPVAAETARIDNCYEAVIWPATIAWGGGAHRVELAASPNLHAAVVYSDATADALCIEPVGHVSNALNLCHQSPANLAIAPGAEFEARLSMRALAGDALPTG